MRTVVIKNNTAVEKIWIKSFTAGEEYTIPTDAPGLLEKYASYGPLLTAIGNAEALIGNGSLFFSTVNDQLNWLRGDVPIDANVTAQPPFGTPDYRTRWDAAEGEQTCAANSQVDVDFQLTTLRSSFGGDIVGSGFELGDWINACIYDKDGVIPEPYRAVICEAWPVVKTYIYRQYLPANGSGLMVFDMDTKPLVAELSIGLYIRTTLNTINAGSTRKFYCNFKLLEKL